VNGQGVSLEEGLGAPTFWSADIYVGTGLQRLYPRRVRIDKEYRSKKSLERRLFWSADMYVGMGLQRLFPRRRRMDKEYRSKKGLERPSYAFSVG